MTAIPYWIQRADFSATDYEPVDVADGIRAFERHDWRGELELQAELESDGAEYCLPGIGFLKPDGDILHICPGGNGRALVHYHFTAWRRFLGLVQLPRWVVTTRQAVHRSTVAELIGFFFDGRHDWMLEKLGPDSKETLG
jgi:hypothetical protein